MKKKSVKFLISLIVLIGSISMTSYAQDFQVTPQQLKQTNILFNKLEYLEKKDSLNDTLLVKYEQLEKMYVLQDSLHVQAFTEQNILLNEWQDDYCKLEKEYNKRNKQYKVASGCAAGGGALSICLLLLLVLL